MKYNEIINEARQGHLYHWVQSQFWNEMMEDNMLPAVWKHYVPYYDKSLVGRSFSRSKNLTFSSGRLLLVFNQAKLAMNNKIFPLDADIAFYSSYRDDPNDFGKRGTLSSGEPAPTATVSTRKIRNYLDEEFVIGDIKNVSSKLLYVVQIDNIWNEGKLDPFKKWLKANKITFINKYKRSAKIEINRAALSKLHFDRLRT